MLVLFFMIGLYCDLPGPYWLMFAGVLATTFFNNLSEDE